jgi:hypothetical protein
MHSLLTRAGAALALAAAGAAAAHPGHGAALVHAHDDWALTLVLLVGALVVGGVAVVRLLRRR